MTIFIFAYILPFILILIVCMWGIFHRTPLERCKRLFCKIVAHPKYNSVDTPKLVDAARSEDEVYLKAYLKHMRKL